MTKPNPLDCMLLLSRIICGGAGWGAAGAAGRGAAEQRGRNAWAVGRLAAAPPPSAALAGSCSTALEGKQKEHREKGTKECRKRRDKW